MTTDARDAGLSGADRHSGTVSAKAFKKDRTMTRGQDAEKKVYDKLLKWVRKTGDSALGNLVLAACKTILEVYEIDVKEGVPVVVHDAKEVLENPATSLPSPLIVLATENFL